MKSFLTLAFFSFFFLFSCGKDISKNKGSAAQNSIGLSAECSCNSTYSPVCDANNITYDNICIAKCHNVGQTVPGNCVCKHTLLVCARNKYTGQLKTLTECEAVQYGVDYDRNSIVAFNKCN